MLRYTDFILESLLLESIVVYSTKFRKILSDIDSPVSKAILDMESQDFEMANNYLDTLDRDQFTFITDRKIKELSKGQENIVIYEGDGGFLKHSPVNNEIFSRLEYTPEGDSTYHPSSGEKGELIKSAKSTKSENIYCKVVFPGGTSIVNKNKLQSVKLDDILFSQSRQPIRIGRGIRSILKVSGQNFTDSQIEDFVNKYKAAWDRMNDIFKDFEVVSGDKIAYWYDCKNYVRRTSTLGSSCMSDVDSDFFDIYVNNPENISMVILKNDTGDKILGRAILWKLDNPKITFMDRIYTTSDSVVQIFKDYCYKNNWYHKVNQNSSSGELKSTFDTKDEALSLTLKNERQGGYNKYPYLDTLKYFDLSTGVLSSDYATKRGGSSVITLEVTDGTWSEHESSCEVCDGDGRVDCYECSGDGNVRCEECYSRSARRSTGKIECDTCDGDGQVNCSTCDGKGEKDGLECSDCSGSGKTQCDDCDGDGENDCSECGGDAEVTCGECGGDGRLDCPEC
jgi:hypothetical protein